MSADIIQVSNLSKSFLSVGQQTPFWALKDISFSLQKGDMLAIIGKNGSGKSTLLKILSEIYRPTTGKAIIIGKVASVLEIGTGFHPDLTGRENISFYGALTGSHQRELNAKFDEIVEMSGLSAFIDTPIKNYSSGMFVRLAVSVILCLHYDVLILDEVVGAGDSEFRLKMAERMRALTQNGTTILMASHNMNELFSCNKVMWLESGNMHKLSNDKNTLIEYMEHTIKVFKVAQAAKENSNHTGVANTEITFQGIKLNAVSFVDENQESKTVFTYDENIYLNVEVTVQDSGVVFPFMFGVFDSLSNLLFGTSYQAFNPGYITNQPGDRIRFNAIFPKQFFNLGAYFVNVYGLNNDGRISDLGKNIATFTVVAAQQNSYGPRGNIMPGIVRPLINWQAIPAVDIKTNG